MRSTGDGAVLDSALADYPADVVVLWGLPKFDSSGNAQVGEWF